MLHVGVPPGVGDVYWVLTKLKAYKAANGGRPVKLLVQACGDLDRAGQWLEMVDFIDHLQFWPFKPDRGALETGLGRLPQGWPILWPNAVVDKGEPLASWLPDLACDLSFPIKTAPVAGGPRTVLYVSSDGINRAWMSHLPPGYWYDVVAALNHHVGRVTIIGAKWDRSFFERWLREAPRRLDVENLIGATTLMQVADILKHARFFVGVISGMTILANHLRTPCLAIYPTAHNDRFPWTWVAEDARSVYWPIRADQVPAAAELGELVRAGARGLAA